MKITELSLKKPVAATVLVIAVIAVGLFSLTQLAVDYLPEITYPMIKIHIWWRGATPEDIDKNLADPIERVISTVDNLDYIESSSIEGMYTLLVNFEYGVNVEEAYQDVISAMGRVARNLPPDIDPPVIIKADPSQLPVMEIAISSDMRDLVWLRDWTENWLTDKIIAVKGTAGAEVTGGLIREIRVHLDPQRLQKLRISPVQISKILYDENREMFAGRITVRSREIIARTMAEFESIQEIENVIIARGPDGEEVALKDVATVEDSHQEMRVNTRLNGKSCVKLNVLKQASANTVEVSKAVQRKLDEIRKDLPEDINFAIVENQGNYVLGAINSVQFSALIAAILVIIVVYLFLGRWRQVVIMMLVLPITLLANFFIMRMAGFSINVFSLGGLAVALGVILDNSIVVLENITRLKKEGIPDYVLAGANEVSSAIFAGTLTFLSIFLPFIFIPGLAALLFKELVFVVAGIVAISLFVALTLTPLLSKALLSREASGAGSKIAKLFDRAINNISVKFEKILSYCLNAKFLVILLILIAFVLCIMLGIKTGSEFLPKVDDGRIMVKLKMPSGTAVGEVDRILSKIEAQIKDLPEISSIFTLAGGKVWGLATYEIANEGELDIQLVPKSKRNITTEAFIKKLQPIVGKVPAPGGKTPVMQMKIKGIRQIGVQDVEIKIKGGEIEPVYEFAKQVANRLEGIKGLSNVNISMDITKPEFQVLIDRARCSARGISAVQIATNLQALIRGVVATQFRDGSNYYDIRVMVPESKLTGKEDLESMIIDTRNNEPVYLRDVANVVRAVGPVEIIREDQVKEVIVRADKSGISVGKANEIARNAVAQIDRPAGVEFEMGGQAQMMAENRKTMSLIIVFSVLFAYIILAIQFDSFKIPVLIIINIPLALTGAFLALYLTNTPIGVTVLIGLVVMMGGITSQGVILLTLAEEFRKMGMSPNEAARKAAPMRIRPILMTQLTTVLGLVPLAMNLGEGGDMLKPMAIAVIGGLLYSLILTLLFLPVCYVLIMRKQSIKDKKVIV